MVLDGLSGHPFESLDDTDLKDLSLKTLLLVALASTVHVSDIHAFSMYPSCTQFAPGNVQVALKPNPAFVPKMVGSYSHCVLVAFSRHLLVFLKNDDCICCAQFCALCTYLDRVKGFRKNDQLFVPWARLNATQSLLSQSNGFHTALWEQSL